MLLNNPPTPHPPRNLKFVRSVTALQKSQTYTGNGSRGLPHQHKLVYSQYIPQWISTELCASNQFLSYTSHTKWKVAKYMHVGRHVLCDTALDSLQICGPGTFTTIRKKKKTWLARKELIAISLRVLQTHQRRRQGERVGDKEKNVCVHERCAHCERW